MAIKVLKVDILSPEKSDLLKEASILALVNHPNCMRILAICMTDTMKIITQFMPLGFLCNYICKKGENISSLVLLKWCMQIARVGDSSKRCC